MTQRTKNRIALICIILFVAGLIFASYCQASHITYADFDCPVCGSDHVIDSNGLTAQCTDCLTSFLY